MHILLLVPDNLKSLTNPPALQSSHAPLPQGLLGDQMSQCVNIYF